MNRYRFTVCAVALCAVLVSFAVAAETDDAVAQIIGRITEGGPVWQQSTQLAELGVGAADSIRKALPTAKPTARLACAKALCSLGDLKNGIPELRKLIEQHSEEPIAEFAATLLGEYGRMTSEVAIIDLLDKVSSPKVKIILARSLYSAAMSDAALEKANSTLRKLFKTKDRDVREACALALAEIGDVDADVQAILTELQTEPTLRGALAKNLLRIERLQAQAAKEFQNSQGLKDPLLNEIVNKARLYHVDEPATLEELRDGAAAGIAGVLDPFSGYFSEDDLKKFRERMTGEYAGIGAHVGYPGIGTDLSNRTFTIIRPIYYGPAYRAGLRSYDEIIEVDGVPTKDRDTEDIVRTLRGKVDAKVTVTVRRAGWKENKKFTITRESIKLPTVHSKMLPGKIAYIKLTSFGEKSTEEFEQALTELEKQGAKGLILDRRNNLGGLLTAARDIADMFLKDDKLIVSSRGRNPDMAPREELRTRDAKTHPDMPLVVLVNQRSASASEIVAGALQDHKRATLIGTRTYGKGSVQKVLPLSTAGGKAALKLTVAKYYLPSGRSIHRDPPGERGGVMPDIEIFLDNLVEPHKLRDFETLRLSGELDRYWNDHREKDRKTLEAIAHFDDNDEKRYPGFDKWFNSIKGQYDRATARKSLRTWLRIKLADERGEMYIIDFENDAQLQRAAMELAKRLEVNTEKIEEYKGLMDKFKMKQAKRVARKNVN